MREAEPAKVIIGSRGSELALWQSNWVKRELEKRLPRLAVEIVVIKTKGDKIADSPLSNLGRKGIFTREIDEALLDRRIDLSVHSLKDLPTQIPENLTIRAITEREDVHDVFISHPKKNCKSLNDLPRGAKIATGSLRRKSQLLHYRRDLEIVDIRGNVLTRLQKLDSSDWDGTVLAKAGLMRLNLIDRITEVIPTDVLLPAIGQGALAVEVRTDNQRAMKLVRAMNHEATELATSAERTLLRCLEGGCQVPVGAYARIENGTLKMNAFIGTLDGKTLIRSTIHGDPARADNIATTLAETLLQSGGEKILREIRPSTLAEVPTV